MSTSLKFMIKENEEIHKQISAYSIIPASRVKLIAFKCYGCPKYVLKTNVLFNEAGQNLTRTKAFSIFFQLIKIISVKNWCPHISYGCETVNFISFFGAKNFLSQCPTLRWGTNIFNVSLLFWEIAHRNVTLCLK